MKLRNHRFLLPAVKARRLTSSNWFNYGGWSTDKKYIVFESDDWGSIRVSSPEARQALLNAGDKTDQDPFTRYDALASEDDLELFFGVLSGFKDCKGNHPIITANCVVANPDFARIREADFERYYFEPFTETLKRYKHHEHCLDLWQSGMGSGLFYPQLHGREHVNISKWLNDLRNGDKILHLAFKHEMISGRSSFSNTNLFAYMDAFNYYGLENDEQMEKIVSDGTTLFQNIFGYESKSFVPCCYVWSSSLERILAKYNIKYIQGGNYQLVPTRRGYGCFKKKKHAIGENNMHNQLYLVRNCSFEPSMGKSVHEIDLCLAQIHNSFRWRKPATICTHRLNYVGYIDKSNRDKNLPLLKKLLTSILKIWPDVEFVTTVRLGELIIESQKHNK